MDREPIDFDWPRLAAYFADECSAAERERVEQWINTSPARRTVVEQLRGRWELQDDPRVVQFTETRTESDFRTLARQLVEQTEHRGHMTNGPMTGVPRSSHRRRLGWYAIVGAAILLLGFVLQKGIGKYPFTWAGVTRSAVPVTTYMTRSAQLAEIKLPDGSTATLNVASRLDVPSDFSVRTRTLRLDGEAMFTVAHHEGAPFTVITGGATTRVLGTQFVVQQYAGDTSVVVAVHDGKVSVHSIVVTANQEAHITPHGVVQVSTTDSSRFSFATGVLTLNGLPIRDAIGELNRWYDVDIQLGDPALATHFLKGRFVEGTPADLSAILELALNVRVVREGRVLTLYPR